jgi:hypothetical protein
VKISKLSLCINKMFKYIEDAHSQKKRKKQKKEPQSGDQSLAATTLKPAERQTCAL